MKKINKILVCVDLSEYSQANIEYAISIAGNTEAELILFNVVNQRDINAVQMVNTYQPDTINIQDYIKKSVVHRKTEIQNMVKKHFMDKESIMTVQIGIGTPFEEILKKANEEKVDLIVMGNKGRGNISRTLFGSHAEKVFRHATMPVLSVRSDLHKRK